MATPKLKSYSCDFETTTDPNDCRVWAVGIIEIEPTFSNYYESNDIDYFFKFAEKNGGKFFFHNLKFDGNFIVSRLFERGYQWSTEKKPMTFDMTLSDMGQWYMVDVYYGNKSKGRVKKFTIYDSLKKLPMPVKAIAKSFGLPIMKGDIDYHTYRPVGHVLTKEESAYLRNDVEIVARALYIQMEENKLTAMTVGSDALDNFKLSLDENNKKSKRLFDYHFPTFNVELDNEFRPAYKGGFTWVNPKWQGIPVGKGMVFDVNSLYPAMMRYKVLPYGDPIPFNGKYEEDEKHPLYIQKMRFRFDLKEGHIPTIQIKGNLSWRQNEYLTSSNGEVEDFMLTNVDLKLIQDHYEIKEVEYFGGYKFRAKQGMFDTYIDYWTEQKKQAKKDKNLGLYQLSKLMLNSLYGKFASNPKVTGKYPSYNKETGVVKYKLKEVDEFKDPVYTPMGCFITAYAREMTIRTAQSVFDRILYCDTDSIHILGTEIPEKIKHMIHDSDLGMWAHESSFARAKFVRQKTYVEDVIQKDGSTHLDVKCAGMPDSVKKYVTFENFAVGFSIDPKDPKDKGKDFKMLPSVVKGGVVLKDTVFTIK